MPTEVSFEELSPETSAAAADAGKSNSGTVEGGAAAGADADKGEAADGGKKSFKVDDLPQVSQEDAAEIASILVGAGYKKENINSLLTQANGFQRANYLLENNPQEFMRVLQRSAPKVYEKLLESATDDYLERHKDELEADDGAAKGSNKGRGASSNDPDVAELKQAVGEIKKFLEGQRVSAQYQDLKRDYDSKVNMLLDKLPKEDFSTRDRKAIKALLHNSLAEDAQAQQRIAGRNFTDLPRHLQSVLDDWTADTTSQSDAEKQRREEVAASADKEPVAGADGAGGKKSAASESGDIWEDAVQAVAGDLNKSRKK
jgi:hypothetical protein